MLILPSISKILSGSHLVGSYCLLLLFLKAHLQDPQDLVWGHFLFLQGVDVCGQWKRLGRGRGHVGGTDLGWIAWGMGWSRTGRSTSLDVLWVVACTMYNLLCGI